MRIRIFRPWMIASLAVAAGSLLGPPHADNAASGQEVNTEEVEERLRQGDPGVIAPATVRWRALADGTSYGFAEETAPQPGKYWIGIILGELPELARKQLQLEYGLVVEDVVPDSPAAKAEFKQHDVLLRAGEKQVLKQPADILQAVEAAEETELELTVLRAGKEQTIKVTPVKRPEPEATDLASATSQLPGTAIVPEAAIRKLEDALQQLRGKQLARRWNSSFRGRESSPSGWRCIRGPWECRTT
jgi:membrane-associated protease RseP (regulator of RpoE activity)